MAFVKGQEDRRPRISLSSHLFRRGLHLLSPLLFLYYLFPYRMFGIPTWTVLVLITGVIPLVIEVFRLTRGKVLFGQRPHEERMLGSYAWSLWSSLLIMLVLPQQVALPIIVVYSFSDPIVGEIRIWKKDLVYPLGFIFTAFLFVLFGYNIFLACFAAGFMLLGEATELQGTLRLRPELVKFYGLKKGGFSFGFKTDDDGTTQLVPALFLGLLYLFAPSVFPQPWFHPLSILGG
ncbi:MAG: hypothetical protein MUC62_03000 [Candidatus Thermoplasmatota archaeon]|jgi:hypothetical protein|nr:hypothetical protein [Candidatus Thermoplasmatota archaeon]